jgi:hypothetical protein
MSLRDTIERWRTEFRQGVEDVQGPWGPRNDFHSAARAAGGYYEHAPVDDWGSGSDWGEVPPVPPQPPSGDGEHGPLFAHLVELCEEQQARIAAMESELQQAQALLSYAADLENIIAFPGAMRALEKALHTDSGTGGDAASRTEIFKTRMAVRDRMARGQ